MALELWHPTRSLLRQTPFAALELEMDQCGKTTVEGILVPRSWKADGEVSDLALNTLDEREFVIEDPGAESFGLLHHLRSRVKLTGRIIGNRVVKITSVSVLDSLEMPECPTDEGDER